MGLRPESLPEILDKVVQKIIFHPEKKIPPPVPVASEIPPEQIALPTLIKKRAHIIAGNVRKLGEQKFGPMWAEGYAVLSDGREVFLQQSVSKEQEGEALEINIPYPSDSQNSMHIRYDLRRDEIITYELRREEHEPIVAYGIYDQPDLGTRVPANFTLRDIISPVDEILQLVEIASNNILWEKPELTPVTPV